jgi:hypothetical protein
MATCRAVAKFNWDTFFTHIFLIFTSASIISRFTLPTCDNLVLDLRKILIFVSPNLLTKIFSYALISLTIKINLNAERWLNG